MLRFYQLLVHNSRYGNMKVKGQNCHVTETPKIIVQCGVSNPFSLLSMLKTSVIDLSLGLQVLLGLGTVDPRLSEQQWPEDSKNHADHQRESCFQAALNTCCWGVSGCGV